MTSYSLIGLMSGTSMDGVDLAHCQFSKSGDDWQFSLLETDTYTYPQAILERLAQSKSLSGLEIKILDKDLGTFFGESVLKFAASHALDLRSIDAIASHGHTVFHQPEIGLTVQIGCGATISFLTGLPVINDFRKKDVLHGGQGAPLVPIGDLLLFQSKASAFLNIGGFANVCLLQPQIKAFDICPGNLPFNLLAARLGKSYDKGGEIAKSGSIQAELLQKLNALSYYSKSGPKSLGTEWLDAEYLPLLDDSLATEDLMRTCVEHCAQQIARNIPEGLELMITGGGAKNTFLIERITHCFKGKIHIPSDKIIDYKEALIFAFLGALFLNGDTNCLSAVTGAKKDVCGGVLHLP